MHAVRGAGASTHHTITSAAEHARQGTTRMMLTSIPFFREVIVMSFRCEHCGHTNNEIQSAGKIRRAHPFFFVVASSVRAC